MSKAVNFLALAVGGWIGLRFIGFGLAPGAMAQAPIAPVLAAPSPATRYAGPPRVSQPVPAPAWPAYGPWPAPQLAEVAALPPQIIYSAPPPAAHGQAPVIIYAAPPYYPPPAYHGAPGQAWGMAGLAQASSLPPLPPLAPAMQTTPPLGAEEALPGKPSRFELSSWSYMRRDEGVSSNPIAPAGTLGGSQSGARLLYKFDDKWAASLRATAGTGTVRGGEVAAGLRYRPFAGQPLAITFERRQSLNTGPAGRTGWALLGEAGLYDEPLPYGLKGNGYLQAGLVGTSSPDWFIDGGVSATRPLGFGLSGGLGFWGAAQPGIHRLDAGPRLSLPLARGIHAHVDWRQKLVGNARPGSGPAVTLSAGF